MGRTTHQVRPALASARPLREVLETPVLRGSRVVAGAAGLDRPVERLNVMEVPDILPWVKPREFLLTTAYPLRSHPQALVELIADLDRAGLSGLGIKLGRYLDVLPDGAVEQAEELGFPLVLLPDGVSFDEVFNEVLTGILNQQAEQLARSERIHQTFLQIVLDGRGLEEIAAELADILAGPAAIVAPDGTVLAHRRLDEAGLVPPPDQLRLDGVAGKAIVGDVEVAARSLPISAGARVHGHVVALEGQRPLTDDPLALENAATVAALVMTKQMEVQAVESKYQTDLMHDLLRHVDDPEDALRRAASFGWDLDRRVIALVLRADHALEPVVPDEVQRRPPLGSAIAQRIRERDPGAAVVRFSREVVVLTAAFEGDHARDEAREFARRLVREASRNSGVTVSAGLSRPVARVTDIAAAYEQASRALTIGRRIRGDGAVAHFDDLGAYRVLSLVEDQTELRAFAAEVLGELANDDDATRDLRQTLSVLLDTGGNVAEASRRLHFHYNTLRYRIDKLERIVGPFMVDARRRLDVQLALLILEMRDIDEAR